MQVMPALDDYQPQLLLVSAGFDASDADPLAGMNVTPDGFASMARQLVAAAAKHCAGRMVTTLEGGYDLNRLAQSVEAYSQVILDESTDA